MSGPSPRWAGVALGPDARISLQSERRREVVARLKRTMTLISAMIPATDRIVKSTGSTVNRSSDHPVPFAPTLHLVPGGKKLVS